MNYLTPLPFSFNKGFVNKFRSKYLSFLNPTFTHWAIITIVFILVAIGIGTIFISSYHLSLKFSGHPYLFVKKQILILGMSLPLLLIIYLIPVKKIFNIAPWLFFVTLFLLILVFVPGIGRRISGAYRWITLGVFQFQPSELMKVAFILFFAFIVEHKQARIKNLTQGFLPAFFSFIIPVILIAREPDFSTAIIFFILGFVMLFMANIPLVYLFLCSAIGLLFTLLFIQSKHYVLNRFLFINPNLDPYGKGYHIKTSLDAFKKGSWLGMDNSSIIPSLRYFPDTHTDFTFSVISKIGGLAGTSFILLAFILLFYLCLKIAKSCNTKGNSMIIYGTVTLLALELFLHIMVTTGIIPTTGILLPFISYGGTALVTHLILILLVVKIDNENQQKIKKN